MMKILKKWEKNKALYEKKKTNTNKDIDYTNIKENLKEFQDAYNQSEDDEDKYDILKNYNEVLEEFIDLFDKDFDNETMVEKYYIYVKQLINSYIKLLNMKDQLSKDDQNSVINRIKGYIKIFAKQSSGYLDDLLEIMKEINKKIFYEIVTIVIEELNNCGKKCLGERKKFCKYNSLKYFEKAHLIFTKYIGTFANMSTCSPQIKAKCKSEVALSDSYIKDINSNAILLTPDSLKSDKLVISAGTGFTNNILGLQVSKEDEQEKYQIVLANYEKMLAEIKDNTKEKAICISFILKIAINYIGDSNYKKYYQLGQQCEFIADEAGIDKKEKWYQEFLTIYKEVKNSYESTQESEIEMKERIRKKYKKKFDEIDAKFTKKKGNDLEFINYILKIKPYPEYEEDKNNKNINFKEASQDLLRHLQARYHPDKYPYSDDDEDSQVNYCIIETIESYLNKMFETLNKEKNK